ncbi:DUF3572 family protein [Blastomonas sp.]|uniref:DUF3572 family protein n=1 Tax=Blastomonas sp. TaxID=1909299 RepID=UPI0035938B04
MNDTISRDQPQHRDPVTLALVVLAWLLGDPQRADRLLSLSGMTADQLREGAFQPSVLAEILRYLEGHEPDLIAAAGAAHVSAAQLVDARKELDRM